MKIFWGVSMGYQGLGAGELVKGTEWRESTPDQFLQVKDMEGMWIDVYTIFTIENNEPQYI